MNTGLSSLRCLKKPLCHDPSAFCRVKCGQARMERDIRGVIHSTKISGNFSLKLNGSVRSNRKSFEKSGPPFEVDLFSRLDRSDRTGPFHLTILIHFQSQDLAVRYLPCTKWRKILITEPLWIVNSRSIGVTRTSM